MAPVSAISEPERRIDRVGEVRKTETRRSDVDELRGERDFSEVRVASQVDRERVPDERKERHHAEIGARAAAQREERCRVGVAEQERVRPAAATAEAERRPAGSLGGADLLIGLVKVENGSPDGTTGVAPGRRNRSKGGLATPLNRV